MGDINAREFQLRGFKRVSIFKTGFFCTADLKAGFSI